MWLGSASWGGIFLLDIVKVNYTGTVAGAHDTCNRQPREEGGGYYSCYVRLCLRAVQIIG